MTDFIATDMPPQNVAAARKTDDTPLTTIFTCSKAKTTSSPTPRTPTTTAASPMSPPRGKPHSPERPPPRAPFSSTEHSKASSIRPQASPEREKA